MFQAIILLTAVVLVMIDQITKWLARLLLADGPSPLINGVFEFHLRKNTGVAFGLFQGYTVIFSILTAIMMVALIYVLMTGRFAKYRPVNFCGTLILAGGIGNLIDRVLFGEVTDFLYFKLINFAIFNFADCFVVVGSVILLIYFLLIYKEQDQINVTGAAESGKKRDICENSFYPPDVEFPEEFKDDKPHDTIDNG